VTATRRRVPVIGLVGGIGSGKSFLSKELGKKRRIEIVGGDTAGHAVLKEQSVKDRIRKKFGDGVFDPKGEVDHRRMSSLVFGSTPDAQRARAELEAIVHPRITERLVREIAEAQARPDLEFVVLDAALLMETGWRRLCDHVIFIESLEKQRIERVTQERGWSPEQLRAREESQYPLERKRTEADYVVDNTQSAEHALSQLEEILSRVGVRDS